MGEPTVGFNEYAAFALELREEIDRSWKARGETYGDCESLIRCDDERVAMTRMGYEHVVGGRVGRLRTADVNVIETSDVWS